MKELFKHYKNYIFVLIVPYLIIMFILLVPINFTLQSPGGLTEVENLIEVDYNNDKEVEGTISSTYIMSIKRPTYFQFMLGTFTDYSTISVLSGSNLTYTNQEIAQISYLDKEISVDAAVIVAYEKAAEFNSDITIEYESKIMVYGKAEYLDSYDDIAFGDVFVKMIGDDGFEVTDIADIETHTVLEDGYDWIFINSDEEEYTVSLSKDAEYEKFGITLKNYYIVDQDTVFPIYTESDSNIGGPSGGLLQTLSIYNMLATEDLTHGLDIAGTGTISYDGSVGYIGGVEQKVITAYLNEIDLFFMPSLDEEYYYDNYEEALRVCEEYGIDPTDWLIPVSTFTEALEYLEGLS
jgi:PDZ domain-containing protein